MGRWLGGAGVGIGGKLVGFSGTLGVTWRVGRASWLGSPSGVAERSGFRRETGVPVLGMVDGERVVSGIGIAAGCATVGLVGLASHAVVNRIPSVTTSNEYR